MDGRVKVNKPPLPYKILFLQILGTLQGFLHKWLEALQVRINRRPVSSAC